MIIGIIWNEMRGTIAYGILTVHHRRPFSRPLIGQGLSRVGFLRRRRKIPSWEAGLLSSRRV